MGAAVRAAEKAVGGGGTLTLAGERMLPGCPGFWTLCPEVGAAGAILVVPLLRSYNIHIEAKIKFL